MNKREYARPTNTGRLAARMLTNSVILVTGNPDRPFDLSDHLMPGRPSLALYPSEDASVLSADFLAAIEGPINLIVPDGNWRQTSKMRRRVSHMADIPVVKVPPGPASQYKVRKESKTEGLATIEAIARALGVIEGPDVQKILETIFHTMVERTLESRGIRALEI